MFCGLFGQTRMSNICDGIWQSIDYSFSLLDISCLSSTLSGNVTSSAGSVTLRHAFEKRRLWTPAHGSTFLTFFPFLNVVVTCGEDFEEGRDIRSEENLKPLVWWDCQHLSTSVRDEDGVLKLSTSRLIAAHGSPSVLQNDDVTSSLRNHRFWKNWINKKKNGNIPINLYVKWTAGRLWAMLNCMKIW